MGKKADNIEEASFFLRKGLSDYSDRIILRLLSFLFKLESVMLSGFFDDYSLIGSLSSYSVSRVYLLNEMVFKFFSNGGSFKKPLELLSYLTSGFIFYRLKIAG